MKKIYRFLLVLLTFFGCSENDTIEPEVIVATPLIEFSFAPQVIRAQQEISFSGAWQTGSSVIETWSWDFGDELNSTSTLQNTTFTFASAGTYNVSLTATDADEASSTVTQEITVLEPPAVPFEASIVWSFNNGTPLLIPNDASKPVMGDDGVIYYLENWANADSRIIAVEDLGSAASKKWEALPGFRSPQAPAIGPDGNLYIGLWAVNESIVQVNSDSGDLFYFPGLGTGISNSTTAIDTQGNIYFGTRSEGIFSFDANGAQRWNFISTTGATRYFASPAISADGTTIYAMASNGEVYALNADDGTLKWAEPFFYNGDATGTSISIDADGTIYFTTNEATTALTDNGTSASVKWSYPSEGANNSGVSIGLDGMLYVGTATGLISLNPADGSENWIYEAVISESVPAIDVDGNVYVGTNDGLFLAVNADGELLKQFTLSDNIVNSPMIADDGTVFVEANDGTNVTLHKISVENSDGPAESAWPMKGQNRKNTAMAN